MNVRRIGSCLLAKCAILMAMTTTSQASILLDFSNGSSTLDDGGVGSIIFSSVTTGVDLVVTADSNYQAFNASQNGTVHGDDYQIHLDANNPTTVFTFSFFDSATHSIAQQLNSFNFSLLDLDVTGERVELLTPAFYTLRDDHLLSLVDTSDPSKVVFGGKGGGQVNNPTTSDSLSNQQERVAVNFQFDNVSEFQLAFSTIGTSNGRNFGGDSHTNAAMFDDGPVSTTFFVSTTAVPEPSSGLLLLGFVFAALKRRRRSERA